LVPRVPTDRTASPLEGVFWGSDIPPDNLSIPKIYPASIRRRTMALVDLSVGIEDGIASEPNPATVERMDHTEGAGWVRPVAVFGEDSLSDENDS